MYLACLAYVITKLCSSAMVSTTFLKLQVTVQVDSYYGIIPFLPFIVCYWCSITGRNWHAGPGINESISLRAIRTPRGMQGNCTVTTTFHLENGLRSSSRVNHRLILVRP